MPVKLLKFIAFFAVGGTERQFVYVTKGLDRSRFDVRVGCLSRKGEFIKDIEASNVPISEYTINRLYGWHTMRRQLRLAQDIRREGIQVVHAYGFYPNLFSVPAAKLAGCIAVASVRDTGVFADRKRLKTAGQNVACRMADCVIANSDAVRESLLRQGIRPNHIRVIPNGIVVPAASSSSNFSVRSEFGIDAQAPVIAAVCRLSRAKGVEYFIQAASIVNKRFPATRFLIIGDSPVNLEYKSELRKLVHDLNMGNQILFTGERNDVSRLLQAVNISLLPSVSEGFSNSLLEAMAAGLPIVATNVGGNPEIVVEGETGLLVPSRSPEALAHALTQILESPNLARQFGDAGRQRVIKHFSLESTVRQTENLYLELLASKKPKHSGVPSL